MPGCRPQRSVRCLPVLKENCFFAVNGLCDDVSCWETDPTVHLEGAALRKRRISFQVSLLHVLMELGEVAEYTHEGRGGRTHYSERERLFAVPAKEESEPSSSGRASKMR